ncbi:MAG: metal ABC transporter permease [Chloroflexota bacterium]|nr:metal ABC transporter permease [Chloroflexota bacterium]MDE2897297.1 metal ABC transporter permease [Chloroflexota bacterium]
MSAAQVDVLLVALVVAAACAIPGAFLILRGMAMMSDAISHTVLLGIVLAFFIVADLNSPILILGAALVGLLTVALVEAVSRTGLVREDTAIGLVFPALFSIAVILISSLAGNVHLDSDAVLLGEIAFAPFNRFAPGGVDLGPIALWVMGAILIVNLSCTALFFKELKLTTFDPALAAALGFSPALVHYGLMGVVSVTAVGAFDAVGSILVVALMIGPPATARLLTDRLPHMLGLGVLIGAAAAAGGYWLARLLDANIAGSMATVVGIAFVLVLLLAPHRGLVATARRQRRQRWTFARQMLLIHLATHEGTPSEADESRPDHMQRHMRWPAAFANRVVQTATERDLITLENDQLRLTPQGRVEARTAALR